MKALFQIKRWWRLVLISVFFFALSSFFSVKFLDRFEGWEEYGLIGIFLVALISNLTVFIPIAGLPVAIALAKTVHPLLVTFIYTVGAVIGEITMYWTGYEGKRVLKNIENIGWYKKAHGWLIKYGLRIIFVFAVTPLPFDLLSLAAGSLRYPFFKYLSGLFLGRLIKYGIVIWGGFELINRIFS